MQNNSRKKINITPWLWNFDQSFLDEDKNNNVDCSERRLTFIGKYNVIYSCWQGLELSYLWHIPTVFFMLDTIKTRNIKKLNLSIIRTDDQELSHSNNNLLPYLASSPLHCVQGLVSVVEFFWWEWDINMMDGKCLNLEGQFLQFICPFIQTCSLRSSHFHFLLGQAGQARKTCKAETSKKNCSTG